MEIKFTKKNLNDAIDTMKDTRKRNAATEKETSFNRGYNAGFMTALDLIRIVSNDWTEDQPDPVPAGLAKKITDAVFHYDPYNGTDYDDGLAETEKMLSSAPECWTIIEALCDMIKEA